MCTTEQFDIATFQTFKDNKLCKSGTNENLGPASFDRRKNRTFQHFDPKICIKEDKVRHSLSNNNLQSVRHVLRGHCFVLNALSGSIPSGSSTSGTRGPMRGTTQIKHTIHSTYRIENI